MSDRAGGTLVGCGLQATPQELSEPLLSRLEKLQAAVISQGDGEPPSSRS